MKHWTGFTKSSWPEFITRLQKLVESQLAEANKALYGAGEYSLALSILVFKLMQWSGTE